MVKFGPKIDQTMKLPDLHGAEKWSNLVKNSNQIWSNLVKHLLYKIELPCLERIQMSSNLVKHLINKLTYHTCMVIKSVKLGQTVDQQNGLLYMRGDQRMSNFV